MGRKKTTGVKRTASGRRSRAVGAYAENVEPILTRMRIHGLSEADARDQKAGTFVGRLQLAGVISQAQLDAAILYQRIYEAYSRAMKSPDALRSSSGGGDQGESDTYEHWCRNAIAKRDKAIEAVAEVQSIYENRGRNVYAALDYIVVRDEQLWHLVGDARLALNALAHHFGIERKVLARAEAA